ncbi:MAG: hypothetical protein JXQ23_12080 [Clostridia bacterium]|nr:hypothetical protein [Clostridia bacterium]
MKTITRKSNFRFLLSGLIAVAILILRGENSQLPQFLSYLITLFLTVVIEINIFMYFKINGKMLLMLIVFTNVMTNMLLHIGLGFFNHVIALEIAVVMIELLIYLIAFPCSKRTTVIYTLSANIMTYLTGVYLFM